MTKSLPVFLLALYGKNEKGNLTRAERNAMAKLVPALINGYPKFLRSKGTAWRYRPGEELAESSGKFGPRQCKKAILEVIENKGRQCEFLKRK